MKTRMPDTAAGERGAGWFTLPRPPTGLGTLVARLPQFPPSAAVAVLLNLVLREVLTDDALREARGKHLRISVPDLGLMLTFQLHALGVAASSATPPDVTITANSDAFWALARGHEDADTLFFSRRLVMSGDTELGLLIRNTLETIDPRELRLALPRPAQALRALQAAIRPMRGETG